MKRSLSWIALRLLIVLCVLMAAVVTSVLCSQTLIYENRGVVCTQWCVIGEPQSEEAWLNCMDNCHQRLLCIKYSDR